MIKKILSSDITILFVTTFFVNAGNYALNLFLGRFLGPTSFAEANIIATIMLMVSFIGVGFQLCAAKFTAENTEDNKSLDHTFLKSAKRVGIASTIVLLLLSPILKTFLNFESVVPFIILFSLMSLYLLMSVERGIHHGHQNFRKLSWTYISEMGSRLITTILLVIISAQYGGQFMTEAIAIGFAVSFLFGQRSSNIKEVVKVPYVRLNKTILTFFSIIILYELCQILINNSDVFLVKHYFSNLESGMYSALALIGRIVFYATWIMVTILFPKVIELKQQGKDPFGLFVKSLGAVAAISTVIIIACFFQGELIITLLFGDSYAPMGVLLWKYALATSLFACGNVFVYYNMSLDKYIPVGIALITGIGQIVLISFYHSSLEVVVVVQIILMTVFIIMMIVYQIVANKLESIKFKTKRNTTTPLVANINHQ